MGEKLPDNASYDKEESYLKSSNFILTGDGGVNE